jgi:hypothetical protein
VRLVGYLKRNLLRCRAVTWIYSMCNIFVSPLHSGHLPQSSPHIKSPSISQFPIEATLSRSSHACFKVQWNLRFYFSHSSSPRMTSRTSALSFSLIHLYLNVITHSLSNLTYLYYISFLSTWPNTSQPKLFVLRKIPPTFNKRHMKLWKFPWSSASYLTLTLCAYRNRVKGRWEHLGFFYLYNMSYENKCLVTGFLLSVLASFSIYFKLLL